jgi:hypothetical protein
MWGGRSIRTVAVAPSLWMGLCTRTSSNWPQGWRSASATHENILSTGSCDHNQPERSKVEGERERERERERQHSTLTAEGRIDCSGYTSTLSRPHLGAKLPLQHQPIWHPHPHRRPCMHNFVLLLWTMHTMCKSSAPCRPTTPLPLF